MGLSRQLTRAGNMLGVWLYRISDGRLPGSGGGAIIGLLTVPGRRSGRPRTVPLGFFPHLDGYLVVGTAGGDRQDPQWFRNLRAVDRASIQFGPEQMDVDVCIVRGAEREALWRDVVLANAPRRQGYADKAGRPIPIALLIPSRAQGVP